MARLRCRNFLPELALWCAPLAARSVSSTPAGAATLPLGAQGRRRPQASLPGRHSGHRRAVPRARSPCRLRRLVDPKGARQALPRWWQPPGPLCTTAPKQYSLSIDRECRKASPREICGEAFRLTRPFQRVAKSSASADCREPLSSTGGETRITTRRKSKRARGFEPLTSSLGSWHSTTELRPLEALVTCTRSWALSQAPKSVVQEDCKVIAVLINIRHNT